jgi:hypothetical protein
LDHKKTLGRATKDAGSADGRVPWVLEMIPAWTLEPATSTR